MNNELRKEYIQKRREEIKEKKILAMRRMMIAVFLLLVFICVVVTAVVNTVKNIQSTDAQPALEEKISKSSFPEEVFGITVHTDLIDENSQGRPGIKRKTKYIVLHETGNFEKGTTAESHAIFLKKNSDIATSWHYTVDDTEIYHHIPDNEVAWHAGDSLKDNSGNLNGIGIELCVNKDGDFDKTFENGTKLVAYLLKEYDLTIDAIKTHGDFIDKECPRDILRTNRLEEFKEKVADLLK